MELSAKGVYYSDLNEQIKAMAVSPGDINVKEVCGHRYIGCGLKDHTKLNVYGTLGNDSACYMDGAVLEVFGNALSGYRDTVEIQLAFEPLHHAGDAARLFKIG